MESLSEFFCNQSCSKAIKKNENATELSNFFISDCLPPEAAEGNVEYKLKLINPSQARFEHLVTQMKWRLREGNNLVNLFFCKFCILFNCFL